MKLLRNSAIIMILLSLYSFDLPKEWFKAGDKPDKYEMGIDKGAGLDGKNAATIKSIDKIAFEIIGDSHEPLKTTIHPETLKEPTNTDFED